MRLAVFRALPLSRRQREGNGQVRRSANVLRSSQMPTFQSHCLRTYCRAEVAAFQAFLSFYSAISLVHNKAFALRVRLRL